MNACSHTHVCGGKGLCVPRTCVQLGAGCGLAADGCGGLLDCGTCMAPQVCGGVVFEAFVNPANLASIRLAERLGLRPTGETADGADRYLRALAG